MSASKKEMNNEMVKFIEEYCNGLTVNSNDTFYYASADVTIVDSMVIKKLLEIESKYGRDGVVAFCSKIRKEEPLKQLISEKYLKASEELKNYILFEDIDVSGSTSETWKNLYNKYALIEEK